MKVYIVISSVENGDKTVELVTADKDKAEQFVDNFNKVKSEFEALGLNKNKVYFHEHRKYKECLKWAGDDFMRQVVLNSDCCWISEHEVVD